VSAPKPREINDCALNFKASCTGYFTEHFEVKCRMKNHFKLNFTGIQDSKGLTTSNSLDHITMSSSVSNESRCWDFFKNSIFPNVTQNEFSSANQFMIHLKTYNRKTFLVFLIFFCFQPNLICLTFISS
jgi:hypothetical protein